MKIQILKENLAKALNGAAKFCSPKAQLPILGHVLISAQREGVHILATDLEIGIKQRIGGKVVEVGQVAVPAKMLSEFVGTLPLGVIEIEDETPGKVRVASGGMSASFQTMAAEEFPRLDLGEGKITLGKIKTDDWGKVWRRVEYAVSKDLARPVLTGVLWELQKGQVVATDGYRLSVLRPEGFKLASEEAQILVSGAFWGAAARVFAEVALGEVTVMVNHETKQLGFEGEDLLLMGRLLEGEYPAYKGILPKGERVWGVFDKEEMLKAVRAAMIFARDGAQIVKLKFAAHSLEIAAAAEQGEANSKLSGEVEGEEMTAAFNGKYLMDFLAHAEKNEIRVGMDDPLKPGKFTEVGAEEFEHVVMPIRLREA